jgi:hypothetical protein
MGLAAFAVPLAVVWAGLGIWLGREQQKGAEKREVQELVRT